MICVFLKLVVVFSVTLVTKAVPIDNRLPSSFCETLSLFVKGNNSLDILQIKEPGESLAYDALKSCVKIKLPSQLSEEVPEKDFIRSLLCQETMSLGAQKCQANAGLVVKSMNKSVDVSDCVSYKKALQSVVDLKFLNFTFQHQFYPSVVMNLIKNPEKDPYSSKTKCDSLCTADLVIPVCHLAVSLYTSSDEPIGRATGEPVGTTSDDPVKTASGEPAGRPSGDGSEEPSASQAVNRNVNAGGSDGQTKGKEKEDSNTNTQDQAVMPPHSNVTKIKEADHEQDSESSKLLETPVAKPISDIKNTEADVKPSTTKDKQIDLYSPTTEEKPDEQEELVKPKATEPVPDPNIINSLPEQTDKEGKKPNLLENNEDTQQNQQVPIQPNAETEAGSEPEKTTEKDHGVADTQESSQTATGDAPNETVPPKTIPKVKTNNQDKDKQDDNIIADKNTNDKDSKPEDGDESIQQDTNRDTLIPEDDDNLQDSFIDGSDGKLDGDIKSGLGASEKNAAQPEGNEEPESLNPQPPQPSNVLPGQEDSHFFAYFLTVIIIVILAYLVIHNKQKILGLIVEGRGSQRRRSHSYRKLDTETTKGSQMIF